VRENSASQWKYFVYVLLSIEVVLVLLASGHVLAEDGKSNSSGRLFASGQDDKNLPLYVKSRSLGLDAKSRVFTYEGDVEVTRGDLVITCDKMIGNYNENNRVEVVTCTGNVVITRGASLRASSDRAVYRVPRELIELTEGPEVYHNGSALTADRVTVFVKEDRSEAEGNVRVKLIDEKSGAKLPEAFGRGKQGGSDGEEAEGAAQE